MAVAAKYSKKPLVSVEEVESDSSLGVEDDTEAEPGDDMDIDIKEEVRDSEGEDPLLLDSFIPDDSFPEIKEDDKEVEEDSDEELLTSDDYGDDDDDDTGIKSEELTDSENPDIKDSDTDSKKSKEKVRMASKQKSKKHVRIMAESSDDSESENGDNEADDDTRDKERADEEDIKSGLAEVITKILASSGTKDKLLAKAKKDFMIKNEETGSEFELVDVDGKVKKEVKIKVEDEEEPEDIQKLAHKKQIERQLSHRSDIVTLRDAGLSIRQIAARLGISRTTVCKWIRRNEETGCLSDLARKPRSRVTNKQEDEAIRRMLEENPFISAKAICENLQLNASAATVIRRLNAVGIHRVSTVKERLTRKQREERLSFARHFVGKDLHFWSRVVFSNEKTFTSTDDDQMHAWRRNNTRYDCINICKESSSQGAFVNTWGWFSIHGMGDMIRIEGKLTPAKYVDILRDFFLPSLRAQNHPFPDGPILFIQDQCNVHSERVAEEWFATQQDLELLLLPSIAYDLNPIENIWGNIVNAWKPHKDQTAAELMTSIKEQWELFRNKEQLIHSYVASMPTRLKNIIEKKGGWTIY